MVIIYIFILVLVLVKKNIYIGNGIRVKEVGVVVYDEIFYATYGALFAAVYDGIFCVVYRAIFGGHVGSTYTEGDVSCSGGKYTGDGSYDGAVYDDRVYGQEV